METKEDEDLWILPKSKDLTSHVIDTDQVSAIPSIFQDYIGLQTLTIIGSRWWGLNMKNLPTSLTHLHLIRQSNLYGSCLLGIERMIHLEEVSFDWGDEVWYHLLADDDENDPTGLYRCYGQQLQIPHPIPNLPTLRQINFPTDIFEPGLKPDWEFLLIVHPLFAQIRNRIEYVCWEGKVLQVHLKV